MGTRRRVTTASPYEARFGFCRALRVGDTISVAGTAPIGADGKTVPGDVGAQARRCFEIIVGAVEELGGSRADIVRTRMYLTHIDDWQILGNVHGEFFGAAPPVATMVGVTSLIDPAWRIEIEADAIVGSDDGAGE